MGGNGGLTIEEKGDKEVPISSTGHEGTTVAVMLTAASDCTPLKPPFKAKYRELYDNWIVRGNREETAEGNLKRLRMRAASFKTRGIATAADGSEDHLIHCTKSNGPIQSGRAALEKARILDGAALEEALLLDDEDAALLDVSNSDSSENSDIDASIESESSSEAGPSQSTTPQSGTSKAGGL